MDERRLRRTGRKFAIRRALFLALAAATALGLAACGATDPRDNDPRPPSPINISVKIDDEHISASPTRFGAGPIVLFVANQSRASQELTIDGPRVRQSAGPINPQDTATLKVRVRPGEQTLSVDGGSVRSARLTVGPERPSGQNELLQP